MWGGVFLFAQLLLAADQGHEDACSAQLRLQSFYSDDFIQLLEINESSREFQIGYAYLRELWKVDEALEAYRQDPNIRAHRLHPLFRMPVQVFYELSENIGKLLEAGLEAKIKNGARLLFRFANGLHPVDIFFDHPSNENFVNLWYEFRAAAHFLDAGYKILYFRKLFTLSDSNENGEADLVVESPDGEVVLVEVKSRLTHLSNYRRQFDRYQRLQKGEQSPELPSIHKVLIFIPEGASVSERENLKKSWPEFETDSLARLERRHEKFLRLDYPAKESSRLGAR